MYLDSTTKSIRIVLGEAVVGSECQLTASWVDFTNPYVVLDASDGVTSGTTPADLVAAPSGAAVRIVKEMSIFNADSIPHSITVSLLHGADSRILLVYVLPPQESIIYSSGEWHNPPIVSVQGPPGPTGPAGADGGFKYSFNSATSGDPGSGKFLFNNATFASATQINISETDGNSNALATFLAAQDDSTSTNKCLVIAIKAGGAAYFSFFITGSITDNGSYDTFSIVPVQTFGSISNGDTFNVSFVRTGDKGDAGSGSNITFNKQTASYTLVLTDAGRLVEMNVASANNLTVPPNSSVAFAVGDCIEIMQYGAGQTQVVAGAGVTIRSSGGRLRLLGQYSGGTLIKRDTDEWELVGDITA